MKETPAPRKAPKATGSSQSSTQDNIKKITTELLIRHGYHGTNFRAIARKLQTTTTNIHYHFGSKQGLVERVIEEYVADAILLQRRIWLDENASLRGKLRSVGQLNHQRYRKFNRGSRTNRPWSLIGRMRLEIDVLSPQAVAALASFAAELHCFITAAVGQAVARGELISATPLANVVFLLLNLVNSSSVFTQDAGGFDRIERLFETVADVIFAAYAGTDTAIRT
jgi:TetR/AcrR family transcriptional repressor of nem operon